MSATIHVVIVLASIAIVPVCMWILFDKIDAHYGVDRGRGG